MAVRRPADNSRDALRLHKVHQLHRNPIARVLLVSLLSAGSGYPLRTVGPLFTRTIDPPTPDKIRGQIVLTNTA